MGDKYLTHGQDRVGETRRQIGYIAINAKYRGSARTSQINIQWHANMGKNQKRRLQKMRLYCDASGKYETPNPSNTGEMLKYDIRELRIRLGKLTKWYQEQEQGATRTKTLRISEQSGGIRQFITRMAQL